MHLIHVTPLTMGTTGQVIDPYQELAHAVIKQAADDYRALGKMIDSCHSHLEKQRLEREMKSVGRFFIGEWFDLLNDCDNGFLIREMLDKEVFGND